MTDLWRPRKEIYIKEIYVNSFLFQFSHEIDNKRVTDGSPWSFNRKTLVIARMKKRDIPRIISLNALDLWVKFHDLRVGFMTERIVQEIGNYIGKFVKSCSRNFTRTLNQYM